MKTRIKINKRYLPSRLTRKDRGLQARMLLKSRKMYKKGFFYIQEKRFLLLNPKNQVIF